VLLPASPLCDSKNQSGIPHGEGTHGCNNLRRCSEASKQALRWNMTAENDTENMRPFFCPFGGFVTRTGFLSCLIYHLVDPLYCPSGDRASFEYTKAYPWLVKSYSSDLSKSLALENHFRIYFMTSENACEQTNGSSSSSCRLQQWKKWSKQVQKLVMTRTCVQSFGGVEPG